ncbi:signal-regulatory protein beta-1-like [Talpa occidentalis]|uniref:signal-regulatory protein beta-1-like n=1 Tax=Talpa occidentalis TaxID=50954 RepID=UPI0023F7F79F|nr:signal-regulatory protein beta-1-like [Talpa occidentalis]
MENRHKVQTVESPQATRNPDGTYSLEHTLQTKALREGSEFACWAVQDEQPPIQANITLQLHHLGRKATQSHSFSVQGPLQRSEPGTSIQLTMTASGFSSSHVTVTWLKNNYSLPSSQTSSRQSGHTYNVTSSVLVPLRADDLSSLVLCRVKHNSTTIFRKSIELKYYLRVPPAVTVSRSSPSLDLVIVACHVRNFYPESVQLTWLENCHVFKDAKLPKPAQNTDGTYTLESSRLVNVSGWGSELVVTCKVEHEAQPPVAANLILVPAVNADNEPSESPGPEMPALIFVTLLLGFKVLMVMSFTVTYIHRRWGL